MTPCAWWMPEAQQATFRAALDGFARPGTLVRVPADGVDAALAFLAVVLDESVSLADPQSLLNEDQRRLLLAPSEPVAQARFVLMDGRKPPDECLQPALGTLESPELGATIVLAVDALGDGMAGAAVTLRLRGPGVQHERELRVGGLDRRWLTRRAAWVGAFPMGVDLVLAAPQALVALPRTTHIGIEED